MKKTTIFLLIVFAAVIFIGCGGKPVKTDTSGVPAASTAVKPKPVIAGSTDLKETAGKVVKLRPTRTWPKSLIR